MSDFDSMVAEYQSHLEGAASALARIRTEQPFGVNSDVPGGGTATDLAVTAVMSGRDWARAQQITEQVRRASLAYMEGLNQAARAADVLHHLLAALQSTPVATR